MAMRVRRGRALLAAWAVAFSACGTNLTPAELDAANGSFKRSGPG